MGPSLNKKLFPAYRLTGYNMCDWTIVFLLLKKKKCHNVNVEMSALYIFSRNTRS